MSGNDRTFSKRMRGHFALNNLRRRDPLVEPYVKKISICECSIRPGGGPEPIGPPKKNIGVPHHEIRERLAALLGDGRYWRLEHGTMLADELAVRFHHRLVFIHPFANGNGRHARLMADLLAQRQDRPDVFTWGGADLVRAGDFRQRYIDALSAADGHDIGPLLAFARS